MEHTGRTMCFRSSMVACKSPSSSCPNSPETLNTSGATLLTWPVHSARLSACNCCHMWGVCITSWIYKPQRSLWTQHHQLVVGIRMAAAFTRDDFFTPTVQGIDTLNNRHANTMLAQVGFAHLKCLALSACSG